MKAHLRIPTKEMYAYIEIEIDVEDSDKGIDQIISTYQDATKKYRAASKEKCCDNYPHCSCPQPVDDPNAPPFPDRPGKKTVSI